MTKISELLQACRIHLNFDEQRVIFDERSFSRGFKGVEGNEGWKSNCHVARNISSRLLEAFVCRVRSEAEALVVPGTTLIHNRQRHSLPERPWQQSIKVSRHQDHVKGQVSSPSIPIPIQVGFDGHLVAAVSGLKWCATQAWQLTSGFGLLLFLEVINLPNESAII